MQNGRWIGLDFPAKPATDAEPPPALARALGAEPAAFGVSQFDALAELASQEAVEQLSPDIGALAALPYRGVIVTARATSAGFDFVSRFFAPEGRGPGGSGHRLGALRPGALLEGCASARTTSSPTRPRLAAAS